METEVLEEIPFHELECRDLLPFPSFQHGALSVFNLMYTA
jgi:hypothetical protein